MPWNLIVNYQQFSGTQRDTTVNVNAGQWIAATIEGWESGQVYPWGVLHIAAALPSISGARPVLDHKQLYNKCECYYGSTGIGVNGRVLLYIRERNPQALATVAIYKWS